jgi:hypothetical protein
VTVKAMTIQTLKLKGKAKGNMDKEYSDGFAKKAEDKGVDPITLVKVADVLELHL